jgi:hypothetical protein
MQGVNGEIIGEWKLWAERRKAVFFRFTQSASADRRTDFLFTRTEQVMFLAARNAFRS